MKTLLLTAAGLLLASGLGFAQTTFAITGTPIPSGLLAQNYGNVPKGIGAYDLSICNTTETKQSLVSSRIYQALASANPLLEPIGRDIMLAAILHNQNRSFTSILSAVLSSTSGVLTVVSSSKPKLSGGWMAGATVGLFAGQQLLSSLKPILSPDQLEKFDSQVLEPALVLDGGSCVERTVFVSSPDPKAKAQALSFHVR